MTGYEELVEAAIAREADILGTRALQTVHDIKRLVERYVEVGGAATRSLLARELDPLAAGRPAPGEPA